MDNLIQQLQATPKWNTFENWYEEQPYDIPMRSTWKDTTFIESHSHFQKGVFEKFIESHGFNIEKQLENIDYNQRSEMSDEEILSKRFNECWFIRTAFLVGVYYQTHTLNPNDYTGNSVPFDSFEELLIWYFNN